MEPISFLIWLIIVVVLLGILWWALGLWPMPAPIRTAIMVLAALVLLLYIASRFGLLAGL